MTRLAVLLTVLLVPVSQADAARDLAFEPLRLSPPVQLAQTEAQPAQQPDLPAVHGQPEYHAHQTGLGVKPDRPPHRTFTVAESCRFGRMTCRPGEETLIGPTLPEFAQPAVGLLKICRRLR